MRINIVCVLLGRTSQANKSNAGKVVVYRQDPERMKEVAKKAGAEIKLMDDL